MCCGGGETWDDGIHRSCNHEREAIPCIVMLVLQRSGSEALAPYCASNQPKDNLADRSIASASCRSKECILQESSSLPKHETRRKQSSSFNNNWTSIIQRLAPCHEWRSRTMSYRLLENALLHIERALSVRRNERADDGGLGSGLKLSIQQIETGLVTSSSDIS